MTLLLAAAILLQDPWPLAKGNKWTYKTDQEVDMIYEITGTEKIGDAECFVLEVRTSEDKIMRAEWLKAGKDGVRVHQGRRGKHAMLTIEKPYFKIKTPFEKGSVWKGESRTGEGKVTSHTAEAVAEEDVEVPAGKYKTWKLKTESQAENGGVTTVEWWAPDVGMVRAEMEFNFGGAVTVVYELKEFTKGK